MLGIWNIRKMRIIKKVTAKKWHKSIKNKKSAKRIIMVWLQRLPLPLTFIRTECQHISQYVHIIKHDSYHT